MLLRMLPTMLTTVVAMHRTFRAAAPYEMAGAVAYMCSDDSSYMTGETMLLGGGGPARL